MMAMNSNHHDGYAFEEHVPAQEPTCGIGSFRPPWLQRCLGIRTFIAVFGTLGAFSWSTYTIMVSQITNIEKAFGFSSSTTGLFLTLFEVGYATCSIVASYFAYRAHIPRVIAYVTVVCGVAALLCALPQFVAFENSIDTSEYVSFASSTDVEFCVNKTDVSVTSETPETQNAGTDLGDTRRLVALVLFMSGMILQGVGKAPCYPYSTQFVDDNVNKQNTGFYVGIMHSVAIFGLVVGYGLGSFVSNTYVTLEDIGMSKKDPRYIGAWWLGFIIVGIATIIVSFPMMLFPRRLPAGSGVTTYVNVKKRKRKFENVVKEFGQTIFAVVSYPVYTFTLISVCFTVMSYSTTMGFEPKYLETQFGTPSWKANIILGVVSIGSYSIGSIIGGYLTKRFKMTPYFTVKLAMGFTVCVTAFTLTNMFLGCPQPQIHNPHADLMANGSSDGLCDCSRSQFLPLCGADDVTYYSPCHAGCTNGTAVSFRDCRWVGGGRAESGFCPSDCAMLVPWSVMKFTGSVLDSIGMMPIFIVFLRSGTDKQKALAIGLSASATSMLAWLPGPVIGGKVIDSTCLIWNTGASSGQYCSLYNIDAQRFRLHGMMLGFRCVGHVFMLAALCSARKLLSWRSEEPDHPGDNEPDKQTAKMIQ